MAAMAVLGAVTVVVIIAMVAGWFYVRGRIDGNLMDEMLDDNGNDVPDVLETTEVPGK